MNTAVIIAILIGLVILWAILAAKQRKRHSERLATLRHDVALCARQTANEYAKREQVRQDEIQHRVLRRHA